MNAADILGEILGGKGDGRLTREEQQAMIECMGGASPEALRFLQDELNRETNVRDFTWSWSVPLGMEAKVDMISLSTATENCPEETAFLDELAHGLRLPRDVRSHLHRRLGLPPLSGRTALFPTSGPRSQIHP